MNTQNIYRRIFLSGAIGTAFGYLLALRFGSWWWLTATVPITLGLYGPWEALGAIAALAGATVGIFDSLSAKTEKIIGVIRDGPETALRRAGRRLGIACKIVLQSSVITGAIGVGLIVGLWFACSPLYLYTNARNSVLGDFVGMLLSELSHTLGCLVLSGGIAMIVEWNRSKLSLPILKRTLLAPLESERTERVVGNTANFLAEHIKALFGKGSGVWQDPEGKVFRLNRLTRLAGLTVLLASLPLIMPAVVIFTLCNLAVGVVDVGLTLLLHLSTSASVAAVIGACIGAGSEYAFYPTFALETVEVIRFLAFMAVGGCAGCGIYALRLFLLRPEESALPVSV